ncbi:MAG TPA: pilus assembly protein TadG-related protein, partial [Bryobacteraceae bacterium]
MRRPQERGQAILMVVVAVGMTVLAGIGLMFDVSNMYAQRQMAQNAADASALAAMSSIFNGTNANNATFNNTFGAIPTGGGNPPRLNCGSNDHHTPCYYSRQNGFDPAFGDTVYVDFWNRTNAVTQESGVSFSSNANTPVPLLRVTVIRPVRTTLMGLINGGTSMNVAAQASAGIVFTNSAVPILVLHPTLTSSLSLSGNPNIKICGGPSKSIQVNSCAGTGGSVGGVRCQSSPALSFGGSSSVDLSKAGPLDSGGCTTGTGGNLGNFGYPKTSPSGLSLGSAGRYIDPSSVIPDPLANVPAPTT